MTTPQNAQYDRIIHSLPTSYGSRAEAFRNLYTHGDFHLDLFTVDRVLQQNDQELILEIISIMLDWLHLSEDEKKQSTGYHASYQAIINRLGINQGSIAINQEYLVPLLALLPDGSISASGIPCRRELADIVRILRSRTDWTSTTFMEAAASSSWQNAYTDLSELYAVSTASDIRIEALHYGKLFELLFYRTNGEPTPISTPISTPIPTASEESKNNENDDTEATHDEDNENQDEDDETEVIDPICEDISTFDMQSALAEFYLWIGFDKTGQVAEKLMLSQQASQISQFLCGMDYYHAVSSIFGVIFSLIQKQQRHLNVRFIYMFEQFFFANNGANFTIPAILSDYEKPQIQGIAIHREEQTYMLSYERKLREMGAKSPDEPDHDIGITKRCPTLPFLSEYRLMFISSMYEAATFNGGTYLNASSGYYKYLQTKREEMVALKHQFDEAEEEGLEDDMEELQLQLSDLETTLEVCERFYNLLERFYEAMYGLYNCQFIPHTSIIVAWIISLVDNDEPSQLIIEKYFGININNWKEGYDEQVYYETIQKTGSAALEECSLDFSWGTQQHCNDLELARVYNYNIAHPCSAYDDITYRILAQLIMLDHIDGIDWILEQYNKTTSLQDVDPTVIQGRLSLFAFAMQLDEPNLSITKSLVKRKCKVVVNNQFSESSNIFLTIFCLPHLSDEQCLEYLEYWHGFCQRNSKTNKMHINLYEYWTILNKAWAMRYTRTTRLHSLRFLAQNIIPPTTTAAMLQSKEPNFLALLLSTFVSQSSYSEINPSGNSSSRLGDFACVAYEQELLGTIYSTLFPDLQSLFKAFALLPSPTTLFTPIFVHQSKFAFDYLFLDLKFPPMLQFIPFIINCMLPSCDWASCIDIQSLVLQYQHHLWTENQQAGKKKKGKKGAKKAKKLAADEEIASDTTPKPSTEISIDGNTFRSGDSQFFSFMNCSMIVAMETHEVNTTFQLKTLLEPSLSNKNNQNQLNEINRLNTAVVNELGENYCYQMRNHEENTFTVETFNENVDNDKMNTYSFGVFNKHILSPYKDEMIDIAVKTGHNDTKEEIGTQINDLFYTCLSPDKHLSYVAKYDLLSLNTQLIDAILWHIERNERILSEDYGGVNLSYAFVLYALSVTLTLFIQDANEKYDKYVSADGQSQDDPECPSTPSQQFVQLYMALVSSLSVPQASPIYQTLQLLFTPSQPFPVAYQHFLLRVNSPELTKFYSPWVQNLYARYANVRMVGELAVDLERLVQNSPQGKLLLGCNDDNNQQYSINSKITWDLDTITTEYTATPLFQVILSAIMTECASQSYMNLFQQHYPQRIQFIQTLMRAQYSRGQQPSPFCSHTYKFTGLSGFQHLIGLFRTIKSVPLPLLNIFFNLFPSIDMTTTIATAVDVQNVQQLWNFYSSKRLSSTTLPDKKLSLLSLGSHPCWIIDLLDVIVSCQVASSNTTPKYFHSLVSAANAIVNKNEPVTDTQLYIATNNPIFGPFLSFSQYYTPIVSTNEMLTMNFWPQLMNSFSSLTTKIDKFFVFAEQQGQSSGDVNDINFTPEEQFTLLSIDPLWAQGISDLINKYHPENQLSPKQIEVMLFSLLQYSTHNFIRKHDEQQDFLGTEYPAESVMGFNMNELINGTVQPVQTKKGQKEEEEEALRNLPVKSPSLPIGTTSNGDKGGKGMLTLANSLPATAKSTTKTAKTADDTTKIPTELTKTAQSNTESPQSIHSEQENTSSSGISNMVKLGAAVGVLGAALYAGFSYFHSQQPTEKKENA